MENEQKNFSVPIVSDSNPNDWYIYFEFLHDGKWHVFKKREGINRIKKLKQRRKEAEGLALARLEWLKQGWNPVVDHNFKFCSDTRIISKEEMRSMPFNKALDFALSKTDVAKKSKSGYAGQVKQVQATAERLGVDKFPVSQISQVTVLQLLEKLQQDKKLSGNRYNTYRDTIRAMFTILVTWQAMESNQAVNIKRKRTVESNKYASLDKEERLAIKELLHKQYANFYVIVQILFHTGIRPKEILALQVKDINVKKQEITIVPDLERENSKTKNIRAIPICNELLPFLVDLELTKYPDEYYVFGSPLPAGKSNKGFGSNQWIKKADGTRERAPQLAKRNDYFSTSPNQVNRDTITKLWNDLIIDGLGINKHLYALKHTGADAKILAGMELDELRIIFGQRSKYTTEKYVKALKLLHSDKIKKISPAFC